jgi:predicted peptidase
MNIMATITIGLAFSCYCDAAPSRSTQEEIPKFIKKELARLFDKGELAVPDGIKFDKMQFRLFKPAVQSGKQYPLIIYLNGHARRQLDYHNVGQLSHLDQLIFHEPNAPEKYPFFLLVPQCPKDAEGNWLQWFNEPRRGNKDSFGADPVEAVARVVEEVVKDNPIDTDCVTVFGISTGGTACWELAMRHPDTFAAVVPIASFPCATDDNRLANLRVVPVWAFHSTGDKPKLVCEMVSQLHSAGGDCRLTQIPSDIHACWDQAFGEYHLVEWMLAQRRHIGQLKHHHTSSQSIWWQCVRHDYCRLESLQLKWNEFWPRAIPVAAFLGVFLACKKCCCRTI